MKSIAHTVADLLHILSTIPPDTPVSFAGEPSLALFLQEDTAGNRIITIDSQHFELDQQ